MTAIRPFVLALTGSIGMGKSTTAALFGDQGVPVWDADATVHRLYARDGAAVAEIAAIHPAAIVDGAVDRAVLREWIASDETAIKQIERVVHPLVAQDRQQFFDQAKSQGHQFVVVDIPLLFETGGQAHVDAVVVVSAPPDIQKTRVMERKTMTKAHFARILASQMPDKEKRKRADYIIETITIDQARQSVREILDDLKGRIENHA